MEEAATDQPALAREEWDFSTLIEAEMDACLRYELAREIADLTTCFQGMDEEYFENKARWILATKGEPDYHPEEAWEFYQLLFPDPTYSDVSPPYVFPTVCWQKIPMEFRQRILFYTDIETVGVETFVKSPLDEWGPVVRHEMERGRGIHHLRIHWRQSDASLADDFLRWLKKNRPRTIPVDTHRGRQSVRDDLNALSAMRLRHDYRYDEAVEITQAALGKPLYGESFAWDRAAQRGRVLFRKLFPGAGEPLSGVAKPNRRGRPKGKVKHQQIDSEVPG